MTNLVSIKRDYERALAKRRGEPPPQRMIVPRYREPRPVRVKPTPQPRVAVGPFGEVGRIIRTEREGRGLSLAGFAGPIGAARQTVCHWEQGRSVPRPIFMRRIAEVWDVPLHDLAIAVANS